MQGRDQYLGQARNWMDAAASGDPPAAVIDVWVGAVKAGNKDAFDALAMWLATVGRDRTWPWPADPYAPEPPEE